MVCRLILIDLYSSVATRGHGWSVVEDRYYVDKNNFLGKIKFQLSTRDFFGIPKPTTMVTAIFIIILHLFLFTHNMGITFVHGKDTNRIPLQCHNITLTRGKRMQLDMPIS